MKRAQVNQKDLLRKCKQLMLLAQLSSILPLQEDEDMLIPNKEPQLYLCDDWIQPVEVVRKPKELQC